MPEFNKELPIFLLELRKTVLCTVHVFYFSTKIINRLQSIERRQQTVFYFKIIKSYTFFNTTFFNVFDVQKC